MSVRKGIAKVEVYLRPTDLILNEPHQIGTIEVEIWDWNRSLASGLRWMADAIEAEVEDVEDEPDVPAV